MKNTSSHKLSGRNWAILLIVGLFGQIAWIVENMYFNVFVYQTITDDPSVIAIMVAASAVVATLTTLIMGAYSDKKGRRKPFISIGYILWGLSTIAFALLGDGNPGEANHGILGAGAGSVHLAATLVILLDCIMTFFGSTANDAAFNAWVTDVTVSENRGRVEAVLAILPLISMLIVFGAFDGLTQKGRWPLFFLLIGTLTLSAGVVSLFLIRETPRPGTRGKIRELLIDGLKPDAWKRLPGLYTAFLAMLILSAAAQVYMPYLIIYIQNFLLIDNYALVLAVVLSLASLISVPAGRLIDRFGKINLALISIPVQILGLIAMFFARTELSVMASGTLMLAASMVLAASVNGLIKDYIPSGEAGRFQGVRMIFAVMLPMIIGPFIGSSVIKQSGQTYVDLGIVKQVPTPAIFLAASLLLLLTLLPLCLLRKQNARIFHEN